MIIGDGSGHEANKGTGSIFHATAVRLKKDLAFAGDMAYSMIYSNPPRRYFFGSFARNWIALKDRVLRSLRSRFISINMGCGRHLDKCFCFHPHNTPAGVFIFHRNIVSHFGARLITCLEFAPETNISDTEVANELERTLT